MMESEIRSLIPRDQHGKIILEKFEDVGFWKNYKINIEDYITEEDEIELCRQSIKRIEAESPALLEESEPVQKSYQKMKKGIREYEEHLSKL